ncbi:hypothetical protein [Methanomethylovorans sp.]|uniref:hypothetical protein n=1 Tax=Methanomethylovorans sp. TaxID=2758717 RepID=UPI00351C59BE
MKATEEIKKAAEDAKKNVTLESKDDLKTESGNMKAADEIKKAAADLKKDVTLESKVESKDDLESVMGSKDKLKNVTPDDPVKSVDLESKKE